MPAATKLILSHYVLLALAVVGKSPTDSVLYIHRLLLAIGGGRLLGSRLGAQVEEGMQAWGLDRMHRGYSEACSANRVSSTLTSAVGDPTIASCGCWMAGGIEKERYQHLPDYTKAYCE